MLCTVDAISKEQNITYMLAGGTLLGAVRDHGFIPWDDDIDLLIWRKDYPAFSQALRRCLPSHLKLIEPADLAPGFYDFVPRIEDQRYLLHRTKNEDLYYHNHQNHISIDIFLLDNGANSRMGMRLFTLMQKTIYGLALGHRYQLDPSKYHGTMNLKVQLLTTVGRHLPLSLILNWQDRLWAWSQKPCKYCIVVNEIPQNMDMLNLTEWFISTVDIPFEQSAFPVPTGYHEKLSAQYGEYMIPARDQQEYIKHADPSEVQSEFV